MPSGKRHYRIAFVDAIDLHAQALARSGGRAGILNEHSIQSAIARPYHGYHRTIEEKGAALLEAMNRNHGFEDGNKRTSVLLVLLLLERSGFVLEPIAGEKDLYKSLEDLVVDIADRQATEANAREWLKARVRRI